MLLHNNSLFGQCNASHHVLEDLEQFRSHRLSNNIIYFCWTLKVSKLIQRIAKIEMYHNLLSFTSIQIHEICAMKHARRIFEKHVYATRLFGTTCLSYSKTQRLVNTKKNEKKSKDFNVISYG